MTVEVANSILEDLETGRVRAAEPDPTSPDGWRVNPEVKAAILGLFADRATRDWTVGPFGFRDRASVPLRELGDGAWRIVPGGTSIRAGVYLGPGVIVMPPSYINIGAWVGEGTMVDSHVLVGSCAQVGTGVHLAAGVLLGGVLEPAGARPVIVGDEAFVGAGSILLEGVLVGARAVIGAGVTLTGTSRLFDLVEERTIQGTVDSPLVVPEGAVVVPASRPMSGVYADRHRLSVATAAIVKYRDSRTDARVALEEALR